MFKELKSILEERGSLTLHMTLDEDKTTLNVIVAPPKKKEGEQEFIATVPLKITGPIGEFDTLFAGELANYKDAINKAGSNLAQIERDLKTIQDTAEARRKEKAIKSTAAKTPQAQTPSKPAPDQDDLFNATPTVKAAVAAVENEDEGSDDEGEDAKTQSAA